MQMRSTLLLRRNIEALLRARHQSQHDLAMWCRRSDAWLSKILNEKSIGNRGLPLKYLDRIADFFGIATYQLFQPGIHTLHERRKQERRSGVDRRVADVSAVLRDPATDTRELVRMLLRASDEDRRAIFAQLSELQPTQTDAPNTTTGAAALPTGAAKRRAARSRHHQTPA